MWKLHEERKSTSDNMKIGVLRESFPHEQRVALVPSSLASLLAANLEVAIEKDAGIAAGFTDQMYLEKGAKIFSSRSELLGAADILLYVRSPGANPDHGKEDLNNFKPGQVIIGLSEPFSDSGVTQALAARGVKSFAMELIPRITRAQSMDALSSMATIAGYKAVLLAASALPRMFPMLMTAAGTIAPARVFVVGAGVAGLQAIATARRLGAVVRAYDLRPAVREQVESLGAKFVELPLETDNSEDKGGYAKAEDEAFYQRQRDMMTKVVQASDVVITTAAVPGRKAPLLVTNEMVQTMSPGSVIVDLAAERGGNCELTCPDETIVQHEVKILGPSNLPSTVPYHASQMYAKNITSFLLHLVEDGHLKINLEDEIIRETLVTKDGEISHPRIRETLGLRSTNTESL
jgi:NAD(P) transhydrogenase subunit alpha